MRKKIQYISGYEHYGKRRDIQVIFRLNEAERAALDDLMAVLGARSISGFVRGQLFGAYNGLTKRQKQQLEEVRRWREGEALRFNL